MNGGRDEESDETGVPTPAADPLATTAQPPGGSSLPEAETVERVPLHRTVAGLSAVLESHYDREQEIARGGMGRIVAAWDRRLGRPVAIKELLRGTDDLRRRFELEAVMTARLQHPAIINVYEAGRWPTGEPFYAMKRVEGDSLADAIRKTASLDERMALLPRLISIAEAMAYAHGQRVIHRDLKPANILIGSFGETVVIDWGLAKDLRAAADVSSGQAPNEGPSDGLTVVGTIMGTPAYMPPEQARGGAVDERADVYALGAILYTLLAGRPPYAGHTSADVLRLVLETSPRSLEDQQSGIAPDLLAIVRKAMAREVGDRYPTARELAEDLRRFQTGQLVGAHVYSPKELLERWVTRHRAPVLIASIAALVLIAAGALAVKRIASERNEAQTARRESDARNDELVLNQARSSLRDDPTAAIAWLKHYSLDAPAWGAARMIAADARSQGVATRVLEGHEHRVNAVAFSPDGRLLASGSNDKTVRIWDLVSGTSRVLKGHDWFVYSLAFSGNGRWLASNGGSEFRLWNVATGEGRTFRGPLLDRASCFSPDGRSAVAIGFDQDGPYLLLVELETGFSRTLRDPNDRTKLSDLKGGRLVMTFTPDGQSLLTQTDDGVLRIWDMKTGKSRTIPGLRASALSRDGRLIAVATTSNVLKIRDRESDRERIIGTVPDPVSTLALSPDQRWLASAGEDALIHLWDIATGEMRTLSGQAGEIRGLVFAPNGRTLGSFGDDRTLRLWDLASGEARIFRGHQEEVLGIGFSPDGRIVASADADRTIRLWSTEPGDHRVLFRPETVPEKQARSIAFGPKGRVLAATWDRESIHVWDLERDTRRVLTGHDGAIRPGLPSGINKIVFSPDGNKLASASSDLTVRLWDLATGQGRILVGHTDVVEDAAFSSDGARLASASWDTTVRLWDVAAGTSRALSGHNYPLRYVAFSPDGRWLASSSQAIKRDSGQQDLSVRVWDAATGEGRELKGHTDTVTDVHFSSDGRTIVSGSMDTTVRLWDAVTGRPQRVLKVDGSIVFQVGLSRDGRWVASSSEGGGMRLWDLLSGHSRRLRGMTPFFSTDSATLASTLRGTGWLWDVVTGEGRSLPDVYSNLAISPDGKLVAALGKDGTIHLWDDDLPRDPEALKPWLDRATHYTVSSGAAH